MTYEYDIYRNVVVFSHRHSLWVVSNAKLTDCSAHSVLSVKAVMATAYWVSISKPDRVPRVSAVSPTADVPFCQSMRYMKDHMSGVAGRSHRTSTLGGTEPASLGLRGGPGQAVEESEGRQYLISKRFKVYSCCFPSSIYYKILWKGRQRNSGTVSTSLNITKSHNITSHNITH